MPIQFENLYVINIRVAAQKGESNVTLALRRFREKFKPFSPETCARHLYVFVNGKPDFDLSLLNTMQKKDGVNVGIVTQISDQEAYGFLLRWAVGLESKRNNQNDDRVRGQLRAAWTEFMLLPDEDHKKSFIPIMQMLFEDATGVRGVVHEYIKTVKQKNNMDEYSDRLRITMTKKLCMSCVAARSDYLTPIYSHVKSNGEEFLKKIRKDQLCENTRKIKILQNIISNHLKELFQEMLIPSERKRGLSHFNLFSQLNCQIECAVRSRRTRNHYLEC